MLVVIFGAGASYDSYPRQPAPLTGYIGSRMPLAKHLFDDRTEFIMQYDNDRFPQCKPILSQFISPNKVVEVEKIMQKLKNEGNNGDSERLKQLVALRYYLRGGVYACEEKWVTYTHGLTNYLTLIDMIRHVRGTQNVCFVTFNYDTLLERALTDYNGSLFKSIDDFLNNPTYKVIKPHGSINWWRKVENIFDQQRMQNGSAAAYQLIENAHLLKVSDEYHVNNIDPYPPPVKNVSNLGLLPAIGIPVESKSEFECPKSHLDALCTDLKLADKIVTIGWRGSEQHFTDLLKQHLPANIPIHIVSGSPAFAEDTRRNLEAAGVIAQYVCHGSTFTDLVTSQIHTTDLERILQ